MFFVKGIQIFVVLPTLFLLSYLAPPLPLLRQLAKEAVPAEVTQKKTTKECAVMVVMELGVMEPNTTTAKKHGPLPI
jgi:hypothetical protein